MGLGDERFSVDAAALAPENYVELAPALAAARGIVSGDKVRLSNGRGTVQARAWVTERVRPFVVDGVEVPVVRLSSPYSWCGSVLVGEGGEAVASVRGDGSTGAPAWQTWTVQIEKA
nr:molybdopterin dinucleotide binding domain-containing protein [uncultured Adlercreutzia sp.]